ncbi:MAG: acyl carrier protein [Candidatus Aminicenantes bacterium]|nr:acyl carrier protein [Candidatus Aminicenantes bacterium]
MPRTLSDEEKTQVYEHIRQFLSDELGVPLDTIGPETKIIDDLGGDSIIYLELIEEFKKKYDVSVEIRAIGRYFQKHPIRTVGETARAVYDIVEKGDGIVEALD